MCRRSRLYKTSLYSEIALLARARVGQTWRQMGSWAARRIRTPILKKGHGLLPEIGMHPRVLRALDEGNSDAHTHPDHAGFGKWLSRYRCTYEEKETPA